MLTYADMRATAEGRICAVVNAGRFVSNESSGVEPSGVLPLLGITTDVEDTDQ
ncbi:Uncharacterised protein [Mycobacteroides abscessus subsp. massiliense]|nr:Uncharacterised protein [Mycobacteroides abscessus subsp. massiliense]